jgi:uncharacterized membrane protein YhaH (DUF805 family)
MTSSPFSPPPATAVPLWAPYYGAPLPEAVRRFWRKYAVFTGRASRSEYWWWVLVAGVIGIVLEIVLAIGAGTSASVSSDGTVTPSPTALFGIVLGIIALWGLATIVPSLALLARRLHDANLSALFILIGLVPFLGGIALLVMVILPSSPEGVRFDVPE